MRATSDTLAKLEARTSDGSLAVRLQDNLKPAVQAHTTYGDIRSDFPILIKSHEQDALDTQPPGTPRVKLQNQNGKIPVVRE